MENEKIKDMSCDIETGVCEVKQPAEALKNEGQQKPIKLLYFTDPICSSCWGIDPQLRKLKQEYGHYFDIEYRMGGLLKSWDEYGGSDVSGPESVAKHWEEASAYYQMPIDGNVWNDDPLHSSYPPGIGFKAAQLQSPEKAEKFLRRIKEMVFLERTNIAREEVLARAAKEVGLDQERFIEDFKNNATPLFEEDLAMARAWGVRGFPTIFFIDDEDNRLKVYGSKPYQVYEQTLIKLLTGTVQKTEAKSYDVVFNQYNTVTLKEFAVFYDLELGEAENALVSLQEQGKVERVVTSAGAIWKIK
ncbi:MAG TPA: DsbA family protein [Flavipsychrobacter sp.]|nr:DsbA family protein [Flavipsychrobacter sp.]